MFDPYFTSCALTAEFTCSTGLGQPDWSSLQFLPHYGLFCPVSSGKVHRSQIRLGWGGDSRPGGRCTAVPHTSLQHHAHECSGCHCHSRSAASAGLQEELLAVPGVDSIVLVLCHVSPRCRAYDLFLPASGVQLYSHISLSCDTITGPVAKLACFPLWLVEARLRCELGLCTACTLQCHNVHCLACLLWTCLPVSCLNTLFIAHKQKHA